MARKTDFTKNKKDTKGAVDVTRIIATSNAIDTNDTSYTKEEYRFSARFTPDQWKFITEKKWRTRQSITAILQEYVIEDMKKHPEILENIDELNG